jgi:hypothetical protein
MNIAANRQNNLFIAYEFALRANELTDLAKEEGFAILEDPARRVETEWIEEIIWKYETVAA